jgi:hypothetical protein
MKREREKEKKKVIYKRKLFRSEREREEKNNTVKC